MKILITGASSGIGRATATLLGDGGHEVMIAARRLDRLMELGPNFRVAELDLSQKTSIDNFVGAHGEWLDGIDVLVNNAGLALGRDSFQNSAFDDLHKMIETNITGLFELTRQILPRMLKHGRGHIVNLGSVAGRTAYTGGAVYCGTKAAVHIFTDALRHDLAGTPIRVSTVAPGRVETDFSKVRFRGDDERAKKIYEGYQALRPHDVAETIAWIIGRPAHVNIQDVLIMPTEQPNATTVVPLNAPLVF